MVRDPVCLMVADLRKDRKPTNIRFRDAVGGSGTRGGFAIASDEGDLSKCGNNALN